MKTHFLTWTRKEKSMCVLGECFLHTADRSSSQKLWDLMAMLHLTSCMTLGRVLYILGFNKFPFVHMSAVELRLNITSSMEMLHVHRDVMKLVKGKDMQINWKKYDIFYFIAKIKTEISIHFKIYFYLFSA